jgi:Yip1 domain
MANDAGGSITPFFTIWTEPRATIRRIVDTDPTRNVIALAAVGPAIQALVGQWSKALSSNANLSVLWPLWVAGSVAFQAAIGVVFLFIFAALFRWSGGLLGGVASRVEVRAAMAWSQVPAITAEIVLLLAVLTGVPVPIPTTSGTFPHVDPAFYKIMVVEGVLAIWGFIVSLKCIGEVHRFSAWRALAAVLIPPIIALVSIAFIVFLISRLFGHH